MRFVERVDISFDISYLVRATLSRSGAYASGPGAIPFQNF